MPAHTSHRLQPLDVTVFAPFKAAIQSELHRCFKHTRCIDVYVAADCITAAYISAVSHTNIVNGFSATGLWDRLSGGPNPEPLTRLFQRSKRPVTVSELMESFSKSSRSLVFDANVCHAGTIRVDTKEGANLTADVVLDALREREEHCNKLTDPYKPSPFML